MRRLWGNYGEILRGLWGNEQFFIQEAESSLMLGMSLALLGPGSSPTSNYSPSCYLVAVVLHCLQEITTFLDTARI